MNTNEVTKRIADYKIVPVVVLNQEKDAVMLAKALENGGIPIAEVTFRTDAVEASIRKIAEKYPDSVSVMPVPERFSKTAPSSVSIFFIILLRP